MQALVPGVLALVALTHGWNTMRTRDIPSNQLQGLQIGDIDSFLGKGPIGQQTQIPRGSSRGQASPSYGGITGYGGGSSAYGASPSGYESRSSAYGASTSGYGGGSSAYGASPSGYRSGSSAYGSSQSGYGGGSSTYGASPSGYGGGSSTYGASPSGYESRSSPLGRGQQTYGASSPSYGSSSGTISSDKISGAMSLNDDDFKAISSPGKQISSPSLGRQPSFNNMKRQTSYPSQSVPSQGFSNQGYSNQGASNQGFSNQGPPTAQSGSRGIANSQENLMSPEALERKLMGDEEYERQHPAAQDLSQLGKITTDPLGKEHLSTYEGVTKHIKLETRKTSAYTEYNDPLWAKQWYLQDYRTKEMPVMDLNVVPVWKMGITGKGVYVSVVDDGVISNHPDLQPNPNKELSYDFNKGIVGSEPDRPVVETADGAGGDTMMHGSKCAGVIAMVPNNGLCGVGIAYGSTIIGVKILGQTVYENIDITASRPANSYEDGKGLVHQMDLVDISSNSYGTRDDGKFPQVLTETKRKFLEMGLTQGRKGKGTIYLVSSGNGKARDDACGADATVNHLGMIAIAAANYQGKTTTFSESCSAVFGTTYSEGYSGEEVSTIDLNGECTSSFSGTSAATPQASGIMALVVEAAKNKGKTLSYRDAMHIITMGAEVAPLADSGVTWTRNGAGFWFSNDFGFGLLNAKNMVKLAEQWQNVPEMHTCEIPVPMSPQSASVGTPAQISFSVRGCEVKWLEAVQLQGTVEAGYRGAIQIFLTSPSGTKAEVMESRKEDSDSTQNMVDWVFKSLHTWGENPEGQWVIEVSISRAFGIPDTQAYAKSFKLMAHGLTRPPPHQGMIPRSYSAFRLDNDKTSHD